MEPVSRSRPHERLVDSRSDRSEDGADRGRGSARDRERGATSDTRVAVTSAGRANDVDAGDNRGAMDGARHSSNGGGGDALHVRADSFSISPVSNSPDRPAHPLDSAEHMEHCRDEERRRSAGLVPVSPVHAEHSFKYPTPLTPTRARRQRLEAARRKGGTSPGRSLSPSPHSARDHSDSDLHSGVHSDNEHPHDLRSAPARYKDGDQDDGGRYGRERHEPDWDAGKHTRSSTGPPGRSSSDRAADYRPVDTTDSAGTSDQSRRTHDSIDLAGKDRDRDRQGRSGGRGAGRGGSRDMEREMSSRDRDRGREADRRQPSRNSDRARDSVEVDAGSRGSVSRSKSGSDIRSPNEAGRLRRDGSRDLPRAPAVGAVVEVYSDDPDDMGQWAGRRQSERREPYERGDRYEYDRPDRLPRSGSRDRNIHRDRDRDRDYDYDRDRDRGVRRERDRDRHTDQYATGARSATHSRHTSRGSLRALRENSSPMYADGGGEFIDDGRVSPSSVHTAPPYHPARSSGGRYSGGPGDFDPYQPSAGAHSRVRTQDSAVSSGWVPLSDNEDDDYATGPHSRNRSDPRLLNKEIHRLSRELYELRQAHRQGLYDVERARRRAEDEWLARVGALERRLIDEQMRRTALEEQLHHVISNGGGSLGLLTREELEHEQAARDRAEVAAAEVQSAWAAVAQCRNTSRELRSGVNQAFEKLLSSQRGAGVAGAELELMQELTPAVAKEAPAVPVTSSHSRVQSAASGVSTPANNSARDADEEDADIERERAIERAKRRERKRAKMNKEMAAEYQNQAGKKTLLPLHKRGRGKTQQAIRDKLGRSQTLQLTPSAQLAHPSAGVGAKSATASSDDPGAAEQLRVAKQDSGGTSDDAHAAGLSAGRQRAQTVSQSPPVGSSPLDIPRPKTKPTGAPKPDREAEAAAAAMEREKVQMRKRAVHLRKEIMIAEQKYADALHVLLEYYVRPISRDAKKLGVKTENLKKLFSNVESIANFHQILYIDMRDEDLAQVFMKNAPFLRMYSEYVASYDMALDLLDTMRDNKAFQEFLNKTRAHPDVGGLKLTDLLIMPVQRIPLYEVLLEKLLEKTDPELPSYGSLVNALQTVRTIVLEVNEKKRYGENLTVLLRRNKELAKVVRGLLKPTRVVVRHGEIHIVKKNLKKAYLFILFNDALVWTSVTSFRYKGIINMASVLVEDGAPANPLELTLRDATKKSSAVCLRFDSAKDKISWYESLNVCISQATLRSAHGQDSHHHRAASTAALGDKDSRQHRTLPRSMTMGAGASGIEVHPLTSSGSGNILLRSSTLTGMSALSLHTLVPPSKAEIAQQKQNLLRQAGIQMTPDATPSATPAQPSTPMEIFPGQQKTQDDGELKSGRSSKVVSDDDDDVPPPPKQSGSEERLVAQIEAKMSVEDEDGEAGSGGESTTVRQQHPAGDHVQLNIEEPSGASDAEDNQ